MESITVAPSTNGANERTAGGRFAPGNAGGPGNPHAQQTARLRAALLEAVSEDDLRDVVIKLVELAKAGSIPAIREPLDRSLGKARLDVAIEATPPRLAANTARLI